MKTAIFTNFTSESFTGSWNGKETTFKAGQSRSMPAYLAQHFAKHLVNRELLRTDASGNEVYSNGEKFTSPKSPEQVPIFMELFNKACKFDDDENDVLSDDDDPNMAMSVSNSKSSKQATKKTIKKKDTKKKATKEISSDLTSPEDEVSPEFEDDDVQK